MITCYLEYTIDAYKLKEFESYARLWIPLVNRFGGNHHGYFLPSEGDSDIAYALFTFPSLAAYEEYRTVSAADDECKAAYEFAKRTRCIINYKRRFLSPIFD